MREDSPIFIVGMPRSGTTLVRTCLCAHPKIAIAPETHFLDIWAKPSKIYEGLQGDYFDKWWGEFSGSQEFRRLTIEAAKVRKELLKLRRPIGFREVFATTLVMYAESKGKNRWGEKTPAHYKYLEVLFNWYPRGKVIFMLRDPRAVFLSLTRTPWGRNLPYYYGKEWVKSCQILERYSEDERVLCVKYESFVWRPEDGLKRICAFLKEEFTSDLLNRSAVHPEDRNPSEWSKNYIQSVLRPISTLSVETWRDRLSEYQVKTIEKCGSPEMYRYGYYPLSKKMTFFQWGRYIYDILVLNKLRAVQALKKPSSIVEKINLFRLFI